MKMKYLIIKMRLRFVPLSWLGFVPLSWKMKTSSKEAQGTLILIGRKWMESSKEETMMEPSIFRTMNPIGVLQKDEIGVPKAWKGVWFWAPHCWD